MGAAFVTLDPEGWLRVTADVGRYAFSPDGQWLAVSEAIVDTAGKTTVRVIETETGRVVLTIAGTEVTAMAFTSPELLLIVRVATVGCRVVLHVVPDGGVMASTPLPELRTTRCKISLSAGWNEHGAALALVCPWRWMGGDRKTVRELRGAVLRLPTGDVVAEIDPEHLVSRSREPEVPSAVAALSADGDSVLFWVSTKARPRVTGAVYSLAWETQTDSKISWLGFDVDEIFPVDVSRWLLRSGRESQPFEDRGDLAVVDSARGVVLYDTRDEDGVDGPGAMGARASISLHPDREKILVSGRRLKTVDYKVTKPLWVGTQRELDVVGMQPPGPTVLPWCPRPTKAMSGAYTGDGDAIWSLIGGLKDTVVLSMWSALGESEGRRWPLILDGKIPGCAVVERVTESLLSVRWRVFTSDGRRSRHAMRVAWRPTATLRVVEQH